PAHLAEGRTEGQVLHRDPVHRLRPGADRHRRLDPPGLAGAALEPELDAELDDLVPALVGPGRLDIEYDDLPFVHGHSVTPGSDSGCRPRRNRGRHGRWPGPASRATRSEPSRCPPTATGARRPSGL